MGIITLKIVKLLTLVSILGSLNATLAKPAQAQSRTQSSVPAPRSCDNASNTLDAQCRCAPDECRLSTVGVCEIDANSQGPQNTNLLGGGSYMCVKAGGILNGSVPNTDTYKIKVGLSSRNDGKTNQPEPLDPFNPDIIPWDVNQYVIYDPENPTAGDLRKCLADPNKRNSCINNYWQIPSGTPDSAKCIRMPIDPNIGTPSLNGICSSNPIFIMRGKVDSKVMCFVDPNSPRTNGFGTVVPTVKCYISCPKQPTAIAQTDPAFNNCSTSTGGTGIDDDNFINGKFWTKLYCDEFNKNPFGQTIPEGATCKLDQRTGRAYWYDPNYFARLKGGEPAKCTALFVQKDLFGKPVDGVNTFFGCLPGSINGLVAFALRLLVGLAGLITFIIILINLLKIVGNSTNPDVVTDSQKKLTSAVITFIVLVLSVTILSIIGLQILDLGEYGGSALRLFTGGR
jgi:hypothetical protein